MIPGDGGAARPGRVNASTAVPVTPLLAAPALAQETRADRRQLRQEKRIDQGVPSGQLNEKEAARLQRGQDRVEKIESDAESDGIVTRKERARIEHAQDVQSRRIYRQKHDGQIR